MEMTSDVFQKSSIKPGLKGLTAPVWDCEGSVCGAIPQLPGKFRAGWLMRLSRQLSQWGFWMFEFCSLGNKPQVLSSGHSVMRQQVQVPRVEGALNTYGTWGWQWSNWPAGDGTAGPGVGGTTVWSPLGVSQAPGTSGPSLLS